MSGTSSDDRERLEAQVARARESGQTHWIGRVEACAVHPGMAPLRAAGSADRFHFEDLDRDEFVFAFGSVDECESAGPRRFADVAAFRDAAASRIAWIGDPRPEDAPTLFGGFGFEESPAASSEWKSFPAARFVLPAAILEHRGGIGRRILLARVEPGTHVEAVESELAERAAKLAVLMATEEIGAEAIGKSPGERSFGWPTAPSAWPAGPEYRVRSDRSHAVFERQVDHALAAFATGELEKVVLARSLSVDHDGELDVPGFLDRLRGLYPTCTVVAMGRGADTFLAATPETLVRVRGDRVMTAALAGSAPRGRDPEEDRRFGEALRADPKERAEHAHVVDAIRDVLASHCASIELPDAPALRQLFGIQHLETPIAGRLVGDARTDVLGLVAELHPTPAVCGVPRAAAGAWLRRFEGLDRGWYAAPIGWLDLEGGGDFRVALRSGLVRNGLGAPGGAAASRALLFAGAGIVEGSLPAQELVETRIKLRALLAPLTEI